jgi:cob(I)alamin adenosyltransferase
MVTLNRIYTKTGDNGSTSLFGGKRTTKDSLRIEAYGTVDELNSALAVARSLGPKLELDEILALIQNDLFILGADLATPLGTKSAHVMRIQQDQVASLEQIIDRLEIRLQPLSTFILPGGSQIASNLHLARTICRRAERFVVKLSRKEKIGPVCTVYLNRLSDLLFVVARYANYVDGRQEIPWIAPHKK